MNEMIEKVARAVADGMGTNELDSRSIAKASIQAMREPSEEMLKSAGGYYHRGLAKDIWQAMIDAALLED